MGDSPQGQMAPGGNLGPGRPARHPGSLPGRGNRPVGRRTGAYFLNASSTSGWSSPFWYISVTMSQPPMNFPLTKTCGIVGQLV